MKEKIRKDILSKRDYLSEEEIKKRSERIKNNLFSLEKFKNAKTVMFYVSKDNEVFTHDMIKETLNEKTVAIPAIDVEKTDLKVSRIDSFSELKTGAFEVLEPRELKKADNIEIVIIPGLAFDKKGSRVGYGQGYYDIFLKKTYALKIGLAFDFQIVENIPVEDHDIPMDIIITESDIIDCNKI